MTDDDQVAILQQLAKVSADRIERFQSMFPNRSEPFVSAKTATPIPAAIGLVRDALVQATLDPHVHAIEFRRRAYLAAQSVELDAIVLAMTDGRFHLDVVAARRLRSLDQEGLFLLALQDLGLASIMLSSEDILSWPRFSNSRMVWRYRDYPVRERARTQIMQHLAHHGPVPLGWLLKEIREDSDPCAIVFAMACMNLIEIDLAERPIGTQTRVASRS